MTRHIDTETTPSLLIRIRDHDDAKAWESFTSVYSPLIYNYCRMRGLQSEDAADVSQEVLVRIARAIRKFEYDSGAGLFRDWVARILNNEIVRFLSSRKQVGQLDETVIQPVAADVWNEHFQQHIFRAALERSESRFSPETWALFRESWINKRPAVEVAEECSVGVDKVYVARSRVLKQLRHEVALLADDWR
ncbi:MAG: sigma-70 family RNA polymerase sigma factor [Planctomycetota bacterium]